MSVEREEFSADDGRIKTLCTLPDGAIPTGVVEMCEYLAENGQRQYVYRYRSDSPLSTTVGLLGMVAFDIQRDAENWEPE